MRAIVKMYLAKPTRSGRTVVEHKFTCRKDNYQDVVNQFILDRIHKENFIKVAKFDVTIKQTDGSCIEIDHWSYKPTYIN